MTDRGFQPGWRLSRCTRAVAAKCDDAVDRSLARVSRKGIVMADKKNVHTVPTDVGWANRREGGERASSTHDTKAEAQAAGRGAAKKDGVEHLIHKKDGTIGDRNSYGNDPHPPKG